MITIDGGRLARVLDALRGGPENVNSNNSAGDRDDAARIRERWPDAQTMIKWADRATAGAAAAAVDLGLAVTVIASAGFPAAGEPMPHRSLAVRGAQQRCRETSPGAPLTWTAYADRAAEVTRARTAELRPGELAAALGVPVTEPSAVMKELAARGIRQGPMQVQLGLTATYLSGTQAGILAHRWAREMPPGSRLCMMVPLGGYLALPGIVGEVPRHQPADAAAWLEGAGFKLLHPPWDVRSPGRGEWGEAALGVDGETRIVAATGTLPGLTRPAPDDTQVTAACFRTGGGFRRRRAHPRVPVPLDQAALAEHGPELAV